MRSKTCVLAFAVVLCAGCDDDDGPGSSGVAPNTNAQDLSYEELRRLCEWSNAQSEESLLSREQLCTYKAYDEAGDDFAKCEQERDECLDKAYEDDELDQPGFETRNCAKVETDDIPDDCNATVGEIEACAYDWNEWSRDRARVVSCEDGWEDFGERDLPRSCDGVLQRCKKLWN